MIGVQLMELDTATGDYVRVIPLIVADDGTAATDTGYPTGLEDTPTLDPEPGAWVTLADNPRDWALGPHPVPGGRRPRERTQPGRPGLRRGAEVRHFGGAGGHTPQGAGDLALVLGLGVTPSGGR